MLYFQGDKYKSRYMLNVSILNARLYFKVF